MKILASGGSDDKEWQLKSIEIVWKKKFDRFLNVFLLPIRLFFLIGYVAYPTYKKNLLPIQKEKGTGSGVVCSSGSKIF